MTVIKQKDAIDIYINREHTISITHPDKENIETGKTGDAIVIIHPEDIDKVVETLLELKKEYYEHYVEDE